CKLSLQKRIAYVSTIYVAVFGVCVLLAEISFRVFWNPKYWIHTERLIVGSGQTEAGKKWWPDTHYDVESKEFRTRFGKTARGYGRRPGPTLMAPYRIAFVGDSFTEEMQVAYEATFCARLENMLVPADPARQVVCENFGVSATDLFDYWHRIV